MIDRHSIVISRLGNSIYFWPLILNRFVIALLWSIWFNRIEYAISQISNSWLIVNSLVVSNFWKGCSYFGGIFIWYYCSPSLLRISQRTECTLLLKVSSVSLKGFPLRETEKWSFLVFTVQWRISRGRVIPIDAEIGIKGHTDRIWLDAIYFLKNWIFWNKTNICFLFLQN